MKRIQLNKKVGKGRVRASRTSRPNVSVGSKKGVTLNSAHGVRLAKTFKGCQLAFQNTSFILKGRWSNRDGTNINLSKTGASLSQKTRFGTYNVIKPTRSSATLLGVNFRGQKAANALAVLVLIEFILRFILLCLKSVPVIVRGLVYLAVASWSLVKLTGSLLLFIFLGLPVELFGKDSTN